MKITKVAVLPNEERQAVAAAINTAEPVPAAVVPDEDEDYSDYMDVSQVARAAVASI